MKKFSYRFLTASLLVSLLLPLVSCAKEVESKVAGEYGEQASLTAFRLAAENPFRSAYSAGERATAAAIKSQLDALGVPYQIQGFSGAGGQSENIIVRFEGRGFHREQTVATDIAGRPDAKQPVGEFRQTIVVGAHYDSPIAAEKSLEMPQYDGISDNASGVAALLQIIDQVKQSRDKLGFDVDFVFFGASSDNYQGARIYLDNMEENLKSNLMSVLVIESLYVGDKLYANAGPRSADPEQKIFLRTPLYDLLDISVSHFTGQRLLDNQSGLILQGISGIPDGTVYREFTLKQGDFTPFDQAGYPIVYIESADYVVQDPNHFKENKSSVFESTQGRVRGTAFDSTTVLKEVVHDKAMEERVNAVTFWVYTYLTDGIYNAELR